MYEDEFSKAQQKDPLFRVRQIGLTHAIENVNALDAIKAEIFRGAGNIEISANGMGRGGSQGLTQVTFENIDTEQRRAIRELAKINEVNLTTHATFQVGNLSGLDPRSGFNEAQRKMSMDELKKAIDFSAEATNGGSVVVHTNEFPRAIGVSESEGGFLGGKYEFEEHKKSREESTFAFVDKQSGRLMQLQRNTPIFRPKYKFDENNQKLFLKDEDGNPIYEEVFKDALIQKERDEKPELRSKSEEEVWKQIDDEKKELARIYLYDTKDNNIIMERITYDSFAEEQRKRGITDPFKIQKNYLIEQMLPNVQSSLGQARMYEDRYHSYSKVLDDLNKSLKELKDIKGDMSEQQYNAIGQSVIEKFARMVRGANVNPQADPIDNLNQIRKDILGELLLGQESGASGRSRARDTIRQIEDLEDVKSYALKKTQESIAELGIHAIERTEWMKKNRPNDAVKPITITLENIFPDGGYGSHPEELRNIVKIGREALKEELIKKQNRSESEAKKLAEQTVKITLDTGHLNIWRKYFKPKDGETKEQTDERFKEWYTQEVEKLAKDGYIGNVHIADNLGWDDAHLAAGQGNAPVRRVMEILEKYGYKDVLTSEGGFGRGPSGEFGLQQTWKMAGATMFNSYGGRAMGDEAWLSPGSGRMYSVMEGYGGSSPGGGYFKDITKPQFIFKGYAPDSEDWRPWSGTGME
jgi:hypothetical protein